MGVNVYTESKCDRCGDAVRSDGGRLGYCPLDGWSYVELTANRRDGSGPSLPKRALLCPICTRDVSLAIDAAPMPMEA